MPRVIKGNAEGDDNVATLDEPGGSVTINVVVYNDTAAGIGDATLTSLSEDIYGDITTTGHNGITDTTCATGGLIEGGSSYSCYFVVDVTGEPKTVHDTVTVTLTNTAGFASDTDDANVVITDVVPDISVDKSAAPTSLPEPGGDVEFTVVVTNNSFEPVTITSLSDDVYGTLAGEAGVCEVGTVLAAGASCEFSITQWVEGDYSGPDQVNVFTAKAVDNDNGEATDDDDATVDFENVLPTIEVTKTANPTYVLIPGGNVTFTFVVKNTSTEEPVTITSLVDNIYDTLAGDADCKVGTVLAAGASCDFTITKFVGGSTAGQQVNVFTAKAVDNDNTEATDTDDATVDILATTSKIAPTQTTCQQYRDGTAEDYDTLMYNVSKSKIGSVSPGVIFFWSTVVASSDSFSLEGHQFNDSGALAWKDMGNLDVFLWDSNCDKVQTVTLDTAADGHPLLNVTGATGGATYYFSVKYDSNSLTGISVKRPYPTVNYTFQTMLDGALIVTSPDSVAVKPKK